MGMRRASKPGLHPSPQRKQGNTIRLHSRAEQDWGREPIQSLALVSIAAKIAPVPISSHFLGIEVNEDFVKERAAVGHRWRNPVWRHSDGSFAEW